MPCFSASVRSSSRTVSRISPRTKVFDGNREQNLTWDGGGGDGDCFCFAIREKSQLNEYISEGIAIKASLARAPSL